MKERPEGASELNPGDTEFVKSGIKEVSYTLARYGVDPESVRNLTVPKGFRMTDENIARLLGKIDITGENLKKVVDFSSENGIFNATVIAHAKALVLAEATFDDKLKENLPKFSDRLIDAAGEVLAKAGGKKGLALTVSFATVLAGACSRMGVVPVIPDGGPVGRPTTTETFAPPTQTATEAVTATTAPTEAPTSIPEVLSADQLTGLNSQYVYANGVLNYSEVQADGTTKVFTVLKDNAEQKTITIQTVDATGASVSKDIDPSLYKTFISPANYEGGGIPVIMDSADPTKVDLVYVAGMGDSGEFVPPMEISTDPSNPGKCTYDQLTSGLLVASEVLVAKPFPEGAVMTKWVAPEGDQNGFDPVGTDEEQLASVCKMSADFEGLPNKTFTLINIQTLNPDGKFGILHFATGAGVLTSKNVLNQLSNTHNIGVWPILISSEVTQFWNDPADGPFFRLYGESGDSVRALVAELLIKYTVTHPMEKVAFVPDIAQ